MKILVLNMDSHIFLFVTSLLLDNESGVDRAVCNGSPPSSHKIQVSTEPQVEFGTLWLEGGHLNLTKLIKKYQHLLGANCR